MSTEPTGSRPGPVRLGGVVTTIAALGPAPRSDWPGRPPTTTGFETRAGEDLAQLAELGVTDVRLGLDWARLQPAPGRVDDDWREWYEHVLLAARRHEVAVWPALHEWTVPAWFDDEGGFVDSRATARFWPRWVETAAELFGDRVAGWFPIVDPVGVAARWTADPAKHEDALVCVATAWRDAWRVLRGGPPVATALGVTMVRAADQTVPAAQAARLEDHLRWRLWLRALRDGVVRLPNGVERTIPDLAGGLDVLGLTTALDLPEGRVSDEALRRWEERLGSIVRRAAEDGPTRPLVVAGLDITWPQADERRLLVDAAVRSLVAAHRDGVDLTAVFVDPAVGGQDDRRAALVDRDRDATGCTAAWQTLTTSSAG